MDKIAVLIPCYNESKTIEKVVTDFKKALPEATIYVLTTIPLMVRMRLPERQGRLLSMNTSRAKVMLSAVCSARLMQNVM